jgi:hypothetical protein
MAMTNGDEAAVPLLKFKPGEVYGTSKPMMITPPM